MLFTLSFTLLFLWCAFTALRHLRQQLAIGQLLRSIPGPTIWEAICLNWNVLYGGSHPFDDGAPVGTSTFSVDNSLEKVHLRVTFKDLKANPIFSLWKRFQKFHAV